MLCFLTERVVLLLKPSVSVMSLLPCDPHPTHSDGIPLLLLLALAQHDTITQLDLPHCPRIFWKAKCGIKLSTSETTVVLKIQSQERRSVVGLDIIPYCFQQHNVVHILG